MRTEGLLLIVFKVLIFKYIKNMKKIVFFISFSKIRKQEFPEIINGVIGIVTNIILRHCLFKDV